MLYEVITGEMMRTDSRVMHDLRIAIFPGEHRLSAVDRITVPDSFQQEFHFLLHRGLEPSSKTPGVIISRETIEQGQTIYDSFRITLPAGQHTFELSFQGLIHHPVEAAGKEQARGMRETPGTISEEGVYLAGSSFWYPFRNNFV